MIDGTHSDGIKCVALLICSDLIEDKRTNNKSLINVFNAITTKQLPAVQGKTVLVISVTNAMDHCELQVDLKAPEGTSVLSVNVNFQSQSPMSIHDLVLEFLSVPLNFAGSYSFEVREANHIIGSRSFDVVYQPDAV